MHFLHHGGYLASHKPGQGHNNTLCLEALHTGAAGAVTHSEGHYRSGIHDSVWRNYYLLLLNKIWLIFKFVMHTVKGSVAVKCVNWIIVKWLMEDACVISVLLNLCFRDKRSFFSSFSWERCTSNACQCFVETFGPRWLMHRLRVAGVLLSAGKACQVNQLLSTRLLVARSILLVIHTVRCWPVV